MAKSIRRNLKYTKSIKYSKSRKSKRGGALKGK